MALVLPLLMMIMTGIFTFSIGLYQKLELTEAVSAGGRVLAVDRGDLDPCATTVTAIQNAAPTLAKGNITYSFVLNGTATNGGSCKGPGGVANTNMVPGTNATVTANYTCSLTYYGYSYPSCNLNASITEAIQ